MVRAVLESPCSKAAEKVLSTRYPRAEHLDMYRLCRNYLIFRIIACNGQRSGIIPNMTPSSFERARHKKGGVVLTVSRHLILLLHFNKEKVFAFRFKFTIYFQIKKHKTDFVGPAVVALPVPLQEYVQNFLHMVRSLPRYDPAQMSQTSMFLSVRDLESVPVPLTQSGVNKAINSLWQEVHGRGSRVSATMLRKSIVTHVRRSNPLARDVLATHMSHRASTADRYYNLSNQQEMALPVSSLISQTMSQKVRRNSLHHFLNGDLLFFFHMFNV